MFGPKEEMDHAHLKITHFRMRAGGKIPCFLRIMQQSQVPARTTYSTASLCFPINLQQQEMLLLRHKLLYLWWYQISSLCVNLFHICLL